MSGMQVGDLSGLGGLGLGFCGWVGGSGCCKSRYRVESARLLVGIFTKNAGWCCFGLLLNCFRFWLMIPKSI